MKKIIHHDLHGISQRVKNIHSKYIIIYDTERAVYEVQCSGRKGSEHCLFVPFTSLDCRVLQLLHETSTRNARRIYEQIEESNDLQAMRAHRDTIDDARESMMKILY